MRLFVIPVWLCIFLAGCATEQAPLIAADVVITRPMPGTRMSAGYMTLRNTSDEEIRINRIASPDLASVEMHESVLEDGIARMFALSEVLIPAGRSLKFEAGGKHLMLRHLPQMPATIRLQLYADDALLLSVNVRPAE